MVHQLLFVDREYGGIRPRSDALRVDFDREDLWPLWWFRNWAVNVKFDYGEHSIRMPCDEGDAIWKVDCANTGRGDGYKTSLEGTSWDPPFSQDES